MARIRTFVLGAMTLAAATFAGSAWSQSQDAAGTGAGAPSGTSAGSTMAGPSGAPGAGGREQAQQPAARDNVVEGRVERIDLAHNMKIAGSESAGHAFDDFKLDSGSQITVNGKPASIDELNEGDEVVSGVNRPGTAEAEPNAANLPKLKKKKL